MRTPRSPRIATMVGVLAAAGLLVAACGPTYAPGTPRPVICDPTDTAVNDSGHHDPTFMSVYTQPKGPLSAADCKTLNFQTQAAQTFVSQFATVAQAEAAGWVEAAVWSPGQGIHYVDPTRITGPFDPQRPNWLMFDGNMANSKLTGMMFLVDSGSLPPAGFVGNNDHWHRHGELCTTYRNGVPYIAAEHATDAECSALGGTNVVFDTQWMVHIWLPSYDGWAPTDVFNKTHPSL